MSTMNNRQREATNYNVNLIEKDICHGRLPVAILRRYKARISPLYEDKSISFQYVPGFNTIQLRTFIKQYASSSLIWVIFS